MRIGILGTGTMAAALAHAWQRAGHAVVVGGRSPQKAAAIASRPGISVLPPRQAPLGTDAVIIAVTWEAVDEALSAAGARTGSLAGLTVIDCTNPVDFATGVLKPDRDSAVEHIARLAPGAHLVKALHLYAGQGWLTPRQPNEPPRVVAMCGDDPAALDTAGTLVRDLGGTPVVIGGLERGRQLEEVAGFVVRLVGLGVDPATPVPAVPAR